MISTSFYNSRQDSIWHSFFFKQEQKCYLNMHEIKTSVFVVCGTQNMTFSRKALLKHLMLCNTKLNRQANILISEGDAFAYKATHFL